MPSPVINNALGAWTAGATWLQTYLGNQGTQNTCDFQNNSGTLLFPGDVVIVGNGTSGAFVADPTALGVTTTTTASNPLTVGVVGGEVWNPGSSTVTPATVGGALTPPVDGSWVFSTGTWTSGTATLTDATGSTANIGKAVYGIGWNSNPGQQSIVTAFSGSTYTVTTAPTVTEGSATAYYLGPAIPATGPSFPGITGYGAGSMVPIVTRGWAYVNIGTNTVAASALLATTTTARQAGAVVSSALLIGTFIGVALEAQSAGLGSPDGSTSKVIRAWIEKF